MRLARRVRRQRRSFPAWLQSRSRGLCLVTLGLLTQLGVVQPAYTQHGVVPYPAAVVAAEREQVGTVLVHAGAWLLVAAQRVPLVEGEGPYAYLAPTRDLAANFDGTGLTFNTHTGLIEGAIINTTWIDPDWFAANHDTLVTIKVSGGTFTPSQIQTAIDQAAARNDRTLIVVDAGVVLPVHETRSKGVPYDSAHYTAVVSADWYDKGWQPTGRRPLWVSGPNDERAHLFVIQTNAGNGTPAIRHRATERNQHKYVYVGFEVRRNPALTSNHQTLIRHSVGDEIFTTPEPDIPKGLFLKWGWLNAGTPGANVGSTTVGVQTSSWVFTFENMLATGIAGTSAESKAILIDRRTRYAQIRNSLMEAGSITILSGGTNFTDPALQPCDVWVDRVGLVRRQEWNPYSPTYVAGSAFVCKQHFEIKYGTRFTVQGVDMLNSWRQGQSGAGMTIQCTVQDASLTAVQVTQDIVVRNFRARNCSNPLGFFRPNGSDEAQQDAMRHIDVKNFFGARGRREQLHEPGSTIDALPLWGNFAGRSEVPRVELFGPLDLQWMTLVAPADTPWTRAAVMSAPVQNDPARSTDTAVTIRNVIFPHVVNTIQLHSTTENTPDATSTTGVNVLNTMSQGGRGWVNFGKNVLPRGANDANRRNQYQAAYPEQYAPAALWPADLAAYGYVNPTNDPLDGDYRLASNSPLKGLGDGGRDPGCDHALIDAACGDILDYVPDFITLRFPETP